VTLTCPRAELMRMESELWCDHRKIRCPLSSGAETAWDARTFSCRKIPNAEHVFHGPRCRTVLSHLSGSDPSGRGRKQRKKSFRGPRRTPRQKTCDLALAPRRTDQTPPYDDHEGRRRSAEGRPKRQHRSRKKVLWASLKETNLHSGANVPSHTKSEKTKCSNS